MLFHALAAGVVMDGAARIEALLIETRSGRAAVLAEVFIDCSGDGDLAALPARRSKKATQTATCFIRP